MIFLPLLFAEGQPTSLEKITQSQLEKFIPFMLTCCPEYSTDKPPVWWPPKVSYLFPLSSSTSSQERFIALKALVCRCYEYHGCENVLRFCSRLAEVPPNILKFRDSNHQGFVSIFNRSNNKLIVTFKKKNLIYDKPATSASPFKKLLIKKPKVQPSWEQHIEEFYLCSYCDESFTTAKDAIAHEAACKGDEQVSEEALDQVSVLRCFGLVPSKVTTTPAGTKRGTSIRLTAKSYMHIPISSPLGLKMGSNVLPLKESDRKECLEKLETYCCRKSLSSYIESFQKHRKPRRSLRRPKMKHIDVWAHTYCFNKAQRTERKLTMKTGLNKCARALLEKCKPCCVLVDKLPLLDPVAIHAAARLHFQETRKHKTAAEDISDLLCIDLTQSDSSDELTDDNSDSRSTHSGIFERPSISDWMTFPMSSQHLILPKC